MATRGLPCHGCAYRESIPGSAHSRCVFNWTKAIQDFPPDPEPRVQKWFRFPFNYDPIWGPDTCAQRSETRDPEKVMPSNPLADLMSLLR